MRTAAPDRCNGITDRPAPTEAESRLFSAGYRVVTQIQTFAVNRQAGLLNSGRNMWVLSCDHLFMDGTALLPENHKSSSASKIRDFNPLSLMLFPRKLCYGHNNLMSGSVRVWDRQKLKKDLIIGGRMREKTINTPATPLNDAHPGGYFYV